MRERGFFVGSVGYGILRFAFGLEDFSITPCLKRYGVERLSETLCGVYTQGWDCKPGTTQKADDLHLSMWGLTVGNEYDM